LKKRSQPRQVALFLPPMLGYFADTVMGIQEYAQSAGDWAVEVCPTLEIANATCREWLPDGILVGFTDGDWAGLLRRLKVPAVQVGGTAIAGLARVSTDNHAIGKVAANHFLERGLRRFAFCGYDSTDWSEEREAGYRQVLAQAGHACTVFRGGQGEIFSGAITGALAGWVRSLAKPVAIFTCHDRIAMLLANTCAYLRTHIPEEVAILGVDNDLLACGFAAPPISSVMGSARRVGYEAAVLLNDLMNGGKSPPASILVPPAGVAVRQSTDVLSIADADVVAALKFIREHATRPIEVSDVADEVAVSRRNLERKFQALLNRTPQEEILRARIAHAKMLLLSTNSSVLNVALQTGFPSASKFSGVFRRETSMSPRIFRRLYSTQAAAGAVHHRGKVL
jgi:LacI family transcriptional regulator